ncbi:MAG: hypothetical protein QE263_05420 [Vampirovibrionales bacterium]|nr:hypothetical protein [Vampirovibrionales bacterium]
MFNTVRFGAFPSPNVAPANTVRFGEKKTTTKDPHKVEAGSSIPSEPAPTSYEIYDTTITVVPGGGYSVRSGGNMNYVNDPTHPRQKKLEALVKLLESKGPPTI